MALEVFKGPRGLKNFRGLGRLRASEAFRALRVLRPWGP